MKMGGDFPDYYGLLQVDPDCDARILEIAYHYFAKMYHPDNPETADFDRFNQIVEAYRVLRDPARREEYDRNYLGDNGNGAYRFALHNDLGIDENTAIDDGEMHARMLMHLYDRRRTKPSEPGIAGWLLQEKLGCDEDRFEFHVWYLKSRGYIELTEQGTLAVTADGVDHVIAMSRSTLAEKRLITKLRETGG